MPRTTPAAKLTERVDSIRQYVAEKSGDWSGVDVMFSDTNFEAGHLVVDIWMELIKTCQVDSGKLIIPRFKTTPVIKVCLHS